jgi:F-type H+-transporting ATPase subunit gamma
MSEAIFENSIPKDSWINREKGNTLIIVLSTDQGFCGAFHQSIDELYEGVSSKHPKAYTETFGKRAVHIRQNRPSSISNHDVGAIFDITGFVDSLFNIVMEYVIHNNVFNVLVISGEMKNMFTQIARCTPILPIKKTNVIDSEYIKMDDSRQNFIEGAIKMYISKLFTSLVTEHLVAEYSARIMSTDNAVRNANSMSDELNILYNNIRQSKITQELTEIVASIECVQ